MRSPGMITGMPGGYGVICSARVPADQQVAVTAGHRQHRCLDRQRAAAGGEEGPLSADRACHQLLSPGQVTVGGLAVIECRPQSR